jgi:hypothetical protein
VWFGAHHHCAVLCCAVLCCSLKPACDTMIRFQASKQKMGFLKVGTLKVQIYAAPAYWPLTWPLASTVCLAQRMQLCMSSLCCVFDLCDCTWL